MVEVSSIPTVTIKLASEPRTDVYPRDHHILIDDVEVWTETIWSVQRIERTITRDVSEGSHTLSYWNGGYVNPISGYPKGLSWYAWLSVNDTPIVEGYVGRDHYLTGNFTLQTTPPPAAPVNWLAVAGVAGVALAVIVGLSLWRRR